MLKKLRNDPISKEWKREDKKNNYLSREWHANTENWLTGKRKVEIGQIGEQ